MMAGHRQQEKTIKKSVIIPAAILGLMVVGGTSYGAATLAGHSQKVVAYRPDLAYPAACSR
jgi:hypothetical protein